MAYTVKHTPTGGGQSDISTSVKWDSFQLRLVTTKEVSQLSFDIQNVASHTKPAVGDTIDVYDGATHMFGGRITERDIAVDGGVLTRFQYTVIDWSFDFDAKMVVRSYTNQDPGTIVADIISSFTTGFTATHVATAGFSIPSVAFNYQPPTKCLQKIATMIGWDWYIDADKDVHFFNAETNLAPFNLTDTSGNFLWPSIGVKANLQNLKNSVYVIGGNYLRTYTAGNTPDVYTSVAATLVYPLGYSYDPTTITITLGGVSQTFGIDQKDSDGTNQVMYNAGQNGRGAFLRFTSDPGSGSTIKAFGDAQIPVLGHASDNASIASYGEFQDSVVDKLITTVAEAQSRAQAEILQYGQPDYVLTFRTLNSGLYIGQTITLTSTALGVTNSFTIKEIAISGHTPTALHYDIQAHAASNVSFTDIMTLLLEQELNQNQVDSATILEVLLNISETLAVADTVATSTSSGPYLWGTGKWGLMSWH